MTDTPKSATPMLGGRSMLQFMCRHPAHLIAQGFGSGLSPIMPGTTGTLFGWVSYVALSNAAPAWFSPFHWAFLIVIGFVIGIWACGRTGRDMGVSDHGSMVWDEIIAFWLVLLFAMPASFSAQLWAFVVFRFFDMVKPPPIRFFDKHVKGGFGVMWDDIVAAFYTLLLIAFWRAGTA